MDKGPQRRVKPAIVVVEPGIEKSVVGMGEIAAQPSFRRELVADRRAAVRQHPREDRGRRAVADDAPQEGDVFAHRFERARRIKQHEAV